MKEGTTREKLSSVKEEMTVLEKRLRGYEEEQEVFFESRNALKGTLAKINANYEKSIEAQRDLEEKISLANKELQDFASRIEEYKQEKCNIIAEKYEWQSKAYEAHKGYCSASQYESYWQGKESCLEFTKTQLEYFSRCDLAESFMYPGMWPSLIKGLEEMLKQQGTKYNYTSIWSPLFRSAAEKFKYEEFYAKFGKGKGFKKEAKSSHEEAKKYSSEGENYLEQEATAKAKLQEFEAKETKLEETINSLQEKYSLLSLKVQEYNSILSIYKDKSLQEQEQKDYIENKLEAIDSNKQTLGLFNKVKETKVELKELEEQKIGLEKDLDTMQALEEIAIPEVNWDVGVYESKRAEGVATDEVNSELQFSQEGYEEVTM